VKAGRISETMDQLTQEHLTLSDSAPIKSQIVQNVEFSM